MKLTKSILRARLAAIIEEEFALEERPTDIILEQAPAEAQCDLATPVAFRLAKSLKKSPIHVAQTLCQRWRTHPGKAAQIIDDICAAQPGFVNFTLKPGWIEKRLNQALPDLRLGVPKVDTPLTIVMDYSSPNAARPMHVGHIRSTIIGDALARIFRFLGHNVITDNHLGDWGTQLGLLIIGYQRWADADRLEKDAVGELARIYAEANRRAEENPAIAEAARNAVVKLQSGDPETIALWKQFMAWTEAEFGQIYQRLDVHFDYCLPESFYNPILPEVVKELVDKQVAHESEGATCIFYEEEGFPPLVIQKSDGSYLYPTTDLATIKYRMENWSPDLVIYVTDARQQLYFRQIFAASSRWGYEVQLEHVWFGTILGEDGSPLRTRQGSLVRLSELLDEAEKHAFELVTGSRPGLSEKTRKMVAQAVGIGAVKYADLSQHRTSDYMFSWDKMLSLEGNTAPYMQYAYARIKSIFRQGQVDVEELKRSSAIISLREPEELALGKALLYFGDVVDRVSDAYTPHVLTDYLFELAKRFSSFYNAHRVLDAEPDTRRSRLLLCELVARTIRTGLRLLGVRTLEQM